MSMNPARTFASAFLPQLWHSLWLYFIAPPLGMLLAAQVYVLCNGRVACAKYHHQNHFFCIFCEYHLEGSPQHFLNRKAEPFCKVLNQIQTK
jgi:aquaporin Z